MSPINLKPGEREVFRSKRGGSGAHSGWLWLGAIFCGLQVIGTLVSVPFMFADSEARGAGYSRIATSLVIVAGGLFFWLRGRQVLGCVVTDQRVIAPRLFGEPIVIEPRDVGAAARFVIKYTRYGRVVGEKITNVVVVALRNGGVRRIGPVLDADECVQLLQGMGHGWIDVRALPGLDGSAPPALKRGDVFLALHAKSGSASCGPVFAGPTKLIAFKNVLGTQRRHQLLTIVARDRSPEAVEEAIVGLAGNSEWGQAAVMDRAGRTLRIEGNDLVLAADANRVAFTLDAGDAPRAQRYVDAG